MEQDGSADNLVDRSDINPKELYQKYAAAMVAIITKDKNGDEGIGSAFHVGDGSFVTASHIFENKVSYKAQIDGYRISRLVDEKIRPHKYSEKLEYDFDPRMHPDKSKDVAVFLISELSYLPSIPLGAHLDDWITDHDFILNEVLVLGFPPIPLTKKPVLFASKAQINAVVDLIQVEHVHFLISSMARGGFSGGVVLSEWDFALGVITSSLLKNNAPEELGYLTVLTVEPILECLGIHKLLPEDLALIWDGLFTSTTYYYGVEKEKWAHSWIDINNDGYDASIRCATPDQKILLSVRELLEDIEGLKRVAINGSPHQIKFIIEDNTAAIDSILQFCKKTVEQFFMEQGFECIDSPGKIHCANLIDFNFHTS